MIISISIKCSAPRRVYSTLPVLLIYRGGHQVAWVRLIVNSVHYRSSLLPPAGPQGRGGGAAPAEGRGRDGGGGGGGRDEK